MEKMQESINKDLEESKNKHIETNSTITEIKNILEGINRASLVAQMLKRLPTMWETWVQSLCQEDPWRRKWHPTPVFLPGESHGQRSLAGYSPRGRKESDTTERLNFQRQHHYSWLPQTDNNPSINHQRTAQWDENYLHLQKTMLSLTIMTF